MKRLYIDMDGVLAVFNNQIESEEVLFQEGYYRDLPPQQNVVDAIRMLTSRDDLEVFVLSAVLPSDYAEREKNGWLDRYLPEVDQPHRIFVPCGEDKGVYIGHQLGNEDLLLDDYSKNLHSWCPPGRAVKLMNGINGNFGTWQGATVSYLLEPEKIADTVTEALELGSSMEVPSPVAAVVERFGFKSRYFNNGAVDIMAKNTDGRWCTWFTILPEFNGVIGASGYNTDQSNIWLHETRPDMTPERCVEFFEELNRTLGLCGEDTLRLSKWIAPEDWQEIAGVHDAYEDERYGYNSEGNSEVCSSIGIDRHKLTETQRHAFTATQAEYFEHFEKAEAEYDDEEPEL